MFVHFLHQLLSIHDNEKAERELTCSKNILAKLLLTLVQYPANQCLHWESERGNLNSMMKAFNLVQLLGE